MTRSSLKIEKFTTLKNKKIVFTPGPGSLLNENITGLAPYFGRGDKDYQVIEKSVLSKLKKISGQKKVACFQGSGTLAIEMALRNFVYGKILVVRTGYYSDRVKNILQMLKKNYKKIKQIKTIDWEKIDEVNNKFDWVCASPVETSIGLKIPIKNLYKLKKRLRSKLMLDATGSIGLESQHGLSDLCTFSSCKGLFGLTGSAFIAYKKDPKNNVKSFYMDINTHIDKKITGPYHTIGSLYYVLKKHSEIRKAVQNNKKRFTKRFKEFLIYPPNLQPTLCTYVNYKIKSYNKNVILYKSRKKIQGSVVSHLGETSLGKKSKGEIIKNLK